jgi:hypothetical protein
MMYPRYELVVDGKTKWFWANEVGTAYDDGWSKVMFGQWVQDSLDSPPRAMTEEDQRKIVDAADRHSDSK